MMNNKNNNLIVSSLGLLAVFVLLLVAPTSADAAKKGNGGQYVLEYPDNFYVAPEYSRPTYTKEAPTVATGPATKKAVTRISTDAGTLNGSGSVAGAQDSNLSASAFGSGASFMPNTLLEWILLFILILLGVTLWRKMYVTDKEKHTPLKHA